MAKVRLRVLAVAWLLALPLLLLLAFVIFGLSGLVEYVRTDLRSEVEGAWGALKAGE